MQSGSFVVRLVGSDNPDPFKQFGATLTPWHTEGTAYNQGEAEQAEIFAVAETNDARAAIEAVKTGRRRMFKAVFATLRKLKSKLPKSESGKVLKRQDCKRFSSF